MENWPFDKPECRADPDCEEVLRVIGDPEKCRENPGCRSMAAKMYREGVEKRLREKAGDAWRKLARLHRYRWGKAKLQKLAGIIAREVAPQAEEAFKAAEKLGHAELSRLGYSTLQYALKPDADRPGDYLAALWLLAYELKVLVDGWGIGEAELEEMKAEAARIGITLQG